MRTDTLASQLRKASADEDMYHLIRWSRAAADRLEEQQREIDALKAKRDAAITPDADRPDTELAAEQTGPQERACKTCRWFEDERWVSTYGGTEELKHARCHKGPGSFHAYADDWCGEWSG